MKYYKVEDVIRKRAEDLADTSYWEYGNPKNVDDWIEVAEMEFKDLPTIEASEDCISRAEMLDTYAELYDVFDDYPNIIEELHKVYDKLNGLSNAISRAEGEWLFKGITDDYHIIGQCSLCKELRRIGNYCPNCGAKMKGSRR